MAAFPTAPSHPPPLPRAMVPALLHLAYTEGADGLYAGMGTACASLGISNLLYYALYALLRDALLRASPQRTSLGGVAALPVAAMAGALNVLATNPLWVLVTRLQAHRGGNGGDADAGAAPRPLAVARQVYAEGGIAAFWRGTGASLVMVSNPVVQFAVFEWLMARAAARAKARAGPGGKAAPVGKATVFASGALSKLAATLVTYPFLVLKSRQQAAQRPVPAPASGGDKDGEAAVRAAHPVRVRLLAQLLAVAREEGVQGAVGGPGARESGQCGRHCVAGEGRGVNRMACFLAASPPAVAGVQAPHGTRSEPTPPFHRSVPGAGHEAVPDRARGRHPVHHQGHHHPGDSQSHAQDCEAGLNEISCQRCHVTSLTTAQRSAKSTPASLPPSFPAFSRLRAQLAHLHRLAHQRQWPLPVTVMVMLTLATTLISRPAAMPSAVATPST